MRAAFAIVTVAAVAFCVDSLSPAGGPEPTSPPAATIYAPWPTAAAITAAADVVWRADRGEAIQVTPTLPPPPTTTTTTIPPSYIHHDQRVQRWYQTAIAAGWPASDWRRLSCVIWRESRGIPTAYNGSGRDDSYGLLQLNMKAHRSWVGPLVEWDFTRLFDPYTNLSIGRRLFERAVAAYGSGWQPWRAQDGSC